MIKKYYSHIFIGIIMFFIGCGVGRNMFYTYIHFKTITVIIATVGCIALGGFILYKGRIIQNSLWKKLNSKK